MRSPVIVPLHYEVDVGELDFEFERRSRMQARRLIYAATTAVPASRPGQLYIAAPV